VNEHDYEPIPGLPASLPAGETILWQGAPTWKTLARGAMRARQVAIYFAILVVWGVVAGLTDGTPVRQLAVSSLRLGVLAAVAVALLVLFAWLAARTTLYTITTRRVVMRYGIALPITIQIPFTRIDAAGCHLWSNGAGDLALSLSKGQRIAYLVLWPHARPWKLTRAEPTLRGIPDAASVAQVLGRALAASASQPAKAVTVPVPAETGSSAHLPAAA
jgi:Bacterial PH domain